MSSRRLLTSTAITVALLVTSAVHAQDSNADKQTEQKAETEEQPEVTRLIGPGTARVVDAMAGGVGDSSSEQEGVTYIIELDPPPAYVDHPDADAGWVTAGMQVGGTDRFRECMNEHLDGEPIETGTIVIKRSFGKEGKTTDESITSNDYGPELGSCLRGATSTGLRSKKAEGKTVRITLKLSSTSPEYADE